MLSATVGYPAVTYVTSALCSPQYGQVSDCEAVIGAAAATIGVYRGGTYSSLLLAVLECASDVFGHCDDANPLC